MPLPGLLGNLLGGRRHENKHSYSRTIVSTKTWLAECDVGQRRRLHSLARRSGTLQHCYHHPRRLNSIPYTPRVELLVPSPTVAPFATYSPIGDKETCVYPPPPGWGDYNWS